MLLLLLLLLPVAAHGGASGCRCGLPAPRAIKVVFSLSWRQQLRILLAHLSHISLCCRRMLLGSVTRYLQSHRTFFGRLRGARGRGRPSSACVCAEHSSWHWTMRWSGQRRGAASSRSQGGIVLVGAQTQGAGGMKHPRGSLVTRLHATTIAQCFFLPMGLTKSQCARICAPLPSFPPVSRWPLSSTS